MKLSPKNRPSVSYSKIEANLEIFTLDEVKVILVLISGITQYCKVWTFHTIYFWKKSSSALIQYQAYFSKSTQSTTYAGRQVRDHIHYEVYMQNLKFFFLELRIGLQGVSKALTWLSDLLSTWNE